MSAASEYFSKAETGTPTKAGSFVDLEAGPTIELAAGLSVQPVIGDACMMGVVTWDARGEAPSHAHVEEQLVVVLEGAVELEFDGQVRVLAPGQAAIIPPWVVHRAKARAPRCVTVEVFSPPRLALLSLLPDGEARSSVPS